MKKTCFTLITLTGMLLAACGPRGNTDNQDSLLTDSSIIDTTRIGTSPADTATLGTDKLSTDSPASNP